MSRARGRTFERKHNKRELVKKVLIVCEGSETEPIYFRGFIREKRISSKLFRIATSKEVEGTHPRQIAIFARDEKRKATGDDKYDEVWCVFDEDSHDRIHEAKDIIRDNGLKVAFSAPSFELWYLFHFKDQTAHIERDAVTRRLKSEDCLPNYSKSDDYYELLKKNQQDAIRRAESNRKLHIHNTNVETTNPSTQIDTLIASLEILYPDKK